MKRSNKLLVAMAFAAAGSLAQAAVVDDLLKEYSAQGASNFSAANAEKMWNKDFPDPEAPGKVRNCTSCHGKDMKLPGKHVTTGKVIDPLAPSVNKDRLTDPKFIEKWFLRNCKSVLNRECTVQEKGDFLVFLRTK